MRALLLVLVLAAVPAAADSKHRFVANDTWKSECGGCHVAFPPRTLDAESWRRVMQSLARHYGADASLDAAAAREIGAFLEANAGRVVPPQDEALPRVTRTPWFVREHRKVEAPTWKRASIKTPVNCAACHTEAERGDFRERGIRIPQ